MADPIDIGSMTHPRAVRETFEQRPFEFDFDPHAQAPALEQVIYQALGAASMCWQGGHEGVFDSERATEIARAVLGYLNEHIANERLEAVNVYRSGEDTETATVDPAWARAESERVERELRVIAFQNSGGDLTFAEKALAFLKGESA